MKKSLKKVVSVLFLLVFVVGCFFGNRNIASASDTKDDTEVTAVGPNTVRIYYHLTQDWETVNIWSWTMETTANLAKNPWPGDEMTKLDNNWYRAEITSEENIGVLFADNAGNQTADCKDLKLGKTYWIFSGEDELLNDSGIGGGASVTAVTEPKAGWPEGPEAVTETEDTQSSHLVLYIVLGVLAVAIIIVVIVLAKKKGTKK